MIQGAAILGSEQTAKLLRNWNDGEPLRYRTSGVLVGLNVEQQLKLSNGLSVKPLPMSSDELPVSFPKDDSSPLRDYLGRPVLSVDSTAYPVFSQVEDNYDPGRGPHRVSPPSNTLLHPLCEALSLICNSFVYVKL